MDRSSKPQGSQNTGSTRGGRKQPAQQIPHNNLLGPRRDPAEGKRDIGPKVKR